MQLGLFPMRVAVLMDRRFGGGTDRVRFGSELLTGTVIKRWSDCAQIKFDGQLRDGTARGCLVKVDVVLPDAGQAGAALLFSAMRKGRRRG